MDTSGNYQGGYGILETGENKGLSNGFANWTETQSTDFPVNATSSGCITGFKTVGAVTSMSNGETDVNKAALYSRITGYSIATLPTRKCNQLGEWQSTTNNCQRISCAAINQSSTGTITNIPSNSEDSAKWALWSNSGGASYPAVNAARSSILVDGSIVKSSATSTGICNNNLGFFQISGGAAPTRVCDYLGNWGTVQNACITECAAITDLGIASTTNNGYAYWYKATNISLSGELSTDTNGCNNPSSYPRFQGSDGACKTTGFNGCVSGYIPYPYPALSNKYGTSYALTDGTPNYTETIPRNVSNDTRTAPANPVRTCKSVATVGGQANVWTNTSSTCVNSCPGADIDPRINVGKTQHNASSIVTNSVGGIVTINWPTTASGETAYIDSPVITSQNGSQYFYGRENGYYSLSRKCNSDTKKWETPIAYCVTNDGYIKVGPTTETTPPSAYAYYGPTSGRIVAGSTTGTGTCSSGTYSNLSGSTTASAITCSYKNSNNRIDETYFDTGGVTKCTAGCTSVGGDSFGNATNPSSADTTYYSNGTRLDLNCKSGYGSYITSGSNTPFADCGRSSSDRSGNRPYVTCNNNGNGTASWSSVYNNCEACRSCSGDANTSYRWESINLWEYLSEKYRCTTVVGCSSSCAGASSNPIANGSERDCTDHNECNAGPNSKGNRRNFSANASCTVTCYDGQLIFTAASCSGRCP
jgi:hypothetical protein